MPMELRKRKEAPAPPPPPARKKTTKTAKAAAKVKEVVQEKVAELTASTNGSSSSGVPAVGDTITLDGFGGEIETNDGTKTTLKALVEESKAGVVIFTYPRASTPGCTRQACLFRDAYSALTSASGLAVYGLSTDSPKANSTFRTKQGLPYPLLCDPDATLIGAIGLKKQPKGTTRGVFVVDRAGKVLAAQPGGPEATLAAARKVVDELTSSSSASAPAEEKGEEKEDKEGSSEKKSEEKEEGAPKAEGEGQGEAKEAVANGEEKNEGEEKKD
ncbi:thioredoxin-like protein [Corynascus novoguineensis]|uniref:thioredoxin-dependent peroxiredoxin n=1 Tax=Corynascus novoguineensis TaxID=1126955 RepID=A0AAN7CW06_9PEZI|nr:thioredoxin-like protein [Corynascus novoguineensis]